MAELTPVDRDLEIRLRRYADGGIRPFDARAVSATIATGRPRVLTAGALSAAAIWVLIGLLVAFAVGVIAQRPAIFDARPLVYAPRLGGVFVATATGADAKLIASDGRYGDPRWSPDGRWIAVGHDPIGAAAPPVPVHPMTNAVLPVPDGELLVITRDGALISRLPKPISYAWAPAGTGEVRLAIATADAFQIVRPDGSPIARWPASAFPRGVTTVGWLPRLQDHSAAVLVGAPDGVWVLEPGVEPARIERAWAGSVLSVDADAAGTRLVVATDGCSGSCHTTIDVVDLARPASSTLSSTTELPIRPTFTANGSAILAWPSVIPLDGGPPSAATFDRRIADYDIGGAWTRTAGRRGILFFHQYPGWNDRRWDVHLIGSSTGPAGRLVRDVVGADLLEP